MAQVELPEDIILYHILPKLHVKSLLRFTCVSKRWRLVIKSDLEYGKKQFRLASQHNTLSRRFLLSKSKSAFFESIDLDMPPWTFGDEYWIRKVKKFLRKKDTEIALLGSCNGLVFVMVVINDCKSFYICNPTTGFYKRLQDPSVLSVTFDLIQLEYYGVGYLSPTDDYKVLVACREKGEYVVELFSLRARGWKRIDGPPAENYDLEYHGTLCNEALHWLSWEVEGLVAFDLAMEKFRTMQLPNFTGDGKVVSKLGLSVGGCLCVSRYPKGLCDSIDFWVMKEYDVRDSWTKLCSLKLYEPDVLLLIDEFLVMESSTIAWHGAGWGLLRIDHRAQEVEEQIGYYELHSQVCITDYVESLLWINY